MFLYIHKNIKNTFLTSLIWIRRLNLLYTAITFHDSSLILSQLTCKTYLFQKIFLSASSTTVFSVPGTDLTADNRVYMLIGFYALVLFLSFWF